MAPALPLKPWARGPYDLLQHGEEHRLGTRDFDRRMALISFDNAIESSVTTYLLLNPAQRAGRSFARADVARWLANFHTKLEFLEHHAGVLGVPMAAGRDEMIYYHQLRNELYHGGNGTVPATEHIDGARSAAIWTFSTLFDCDAQALLAQGAQPAVPDEAELSAQTQFMAQFIAVKKALDALLDLLHASPGPGADLVRRLRLAQSGAEIDASALDEAAAEAEAIKNRIVDGQPVDVSEDRLRTLAGQLGSLSGQLQQRLRSHHRDLIDAAFKATLRVYPRGGMAGIVQQALGSGLTLSAIGYLVRCRESAQLSVLPQLVVVDRIESAHDFAGRVQALSNGQPGLAVTVPESAGALSALLQENRPRLIVTDKAQLRCLQGQHWAYPCLVACLPVMPTEAQAALLRRMFPQGIFIVFTSSPWGGPSGQGDWGPVIGRYDLYAAIQDGQLISARAARGRDLP